MLFEYGGVYTDLRFTEKSTTIGIAFSEHHHYDEVSFYKKTG